MGGNGLICILSSAVVVRAEMIKHEQEHAPGFELGEAGGGGVDGGIRLNNTITSHSRRIAPRDNQ